MIVLSVTVILYYKVLGGAEKLVTRGCTKLPIVQCEINFCFFWAVEQFDEVNHICAKNNLPVYQKVSVKPRERSARGTWVTTNMFSFQTSVFI